MKYPSRYSNEKFVSAAQYITEMICEKKAKIDKEDLHHRFWTNKKWSSFFRNQIATAHANVYNNIKTPYIGYNGAMVESPNLIKRNTLILEEQERKIQYKMSNSFHHNFNNF